MGARPSNEKIREKPPPPKIVLAFVLVMIFRLAVLRCAQDKVGSPSPGQRNGTPFNEKWYLGKRVKDTNTRLVLCRKRGTSR
jgi:hypothetical protein